MRQTTAQIHSSEPDLIPDLRSQIFPSDSSSEFSFSDFLVSFPLTSFNHSIVSFDSAVEFHQWASGRVCAYLMEHMPSSADWMYRHMFGTPPWTPNTQTPPTHSYPTPQQALSTTSQLGRDAWHRTSGKGQKVVYGATIASIQSFWILEQAHTTEPPQSDLMREDAPRLTLQTDVEMRGY